MTYWVTMTDRSYSPQYDGKQLKIVIELKDIHEAEKARDYFIGSKNMRYVNICTKKPSYRREGFEILYKTIVDLSPEVLGITPL